MKLLNCRGILLVTLLVCGALNSLSAAEQQSDRIRPPSVATLTPALKAAYDDRVQKFGGPAGLHPVLLNHPDLYKVWTELAKGMAAVIPAQRDEDLALRNLVLLMVGRYWSDSWASLRHTKGIDPDVLAALNEGRIPQFKNSGQRVVYDYVSELLNTRAVSDVTYKHALDLLGTKDLLALTAYIGFANMLSLQDVAHRTLLPKPDQEGVGRILQPLH